MKGVEFIDDEMVFSWDDFLLRVDEIEDVVIDECLEGLVED